MRNLTLTDKLIKEKRGTSVAWLRRTIVSIGIGGVSYAIMFALMLHSVMYDRTFEPIITLAFDTGRLITNWLDSLVAGTYWGQVAVNHLRERVNMTHVVLSSAAEEPTRRPIRWCVIKPQ
jgi:shikimate 5-dehydrogenase